MFGTVLFTDIVIATVRARDLGDAGWDDLIERSEHALKGDEGSWRLWARRWGADAR